MFCFKENNKTEIKDKKQNKKRMEPVSEVEKEPSEPKVVSFDSPEEEKVVPPCEKDEEVYKELKFAPGDQPYVFNPFKLPPKGTMPSAKLKFFCNPTGGNGAAKKKLLAITSAMDKIGGVYDVYYTKSAQDLVETIANLPESFHKEGGVIALVGGDGTFTLALSGIAAYAKSHPEIVPVVVLLPGGTGNDLVRSLGYLNPSEQLLRNLKNPKLQHFDVIKVRYVGLDDKIVEEYACCQVGVGMSASSCANAERFKMLGFLKYKVASAIELVKRPNYLVSASIDGHEVMPKQKVMMFQVNNTCCFGGGVPIAPKAQVDDGLLDVLWANSEYNIIGKMRLFRQSIHGGHHVKDNRVGYYQGKTCKIIIHDKSLLGERDGEVFQAKDWIEVSIAPFPLNYAMII